MENERYQSLFAVHGPELRARFLDGADPGLAALVATYDDDELERIVTNLGGHDLGVLLDAYRACDAVTDRPSVVFAYTIKGWGLPMAGDPLNHAALLTADQIAELRTAIGTGPGHGVGPVHRRFTRGPACARTGGELDEPTGPAAPRTYRCRTRRACSRRARSARRRRSVGC